MIALITSAWILQFWALVIFGGLIYWLPTIIAFGRDSESRFGVLALNFLLGWTVIGWLSAIIWAIASSSGYRAPTYRP